MNGVTYDSQLEATVAGYLEGIQAQLGGVVERQKRLIIIPENDFFKAKYWVIDFAYYLNGTIIPIEVKGGWVNSSSEHKQNWQRKLHLLSLFQEDYFNNLIVFQDFKSEDNPYSTTHNYQELILAIKEIVEWL